jgi:hypothetical protein
MKRVMIMLELRPDDVEYIEKRSGNYEVGLLLRDALGEFEASRFPAEKYVAERYPEMERLDSENKVLDVEKRLRLSRALRHADLMVLVEKKL